MKLEKGAQSRRGWWFQVIKQKSSTLWGGMLPRNSTVRQKLNGTSGRSISMEMNEEDAPAEDK